MQKTPGKERRLLIQLLFALGVCVCVCVCVCVRKEGRDQTGQKLEVKRPFGWLAHPPWGLLPLRHLHTIFSSSQFSDPYV